MIKVIIFDLDGTLYKNPEIKRKFAEAAYHTVSKLRDISIEEAKKLIEEKREKLREKYGSPVPYTITLKSFGVPTDLWHEENIKFFDPRDYLSRDEKLKESMVKLSLRYRLAILTNNNDTQSERILEALNIKNLFEKIFTYNSFKLLKPDPEFLQRALKEMAVKPEECLVVGDRYNVDLNPAKELGMRVFEVTGPNDIYNLPDNLEEQTS
jgi:putative hydrolase of the HAD superfamily